MFISHKYKAIFIHIQRTGGNSVQKLFEDTDPELIEAIAIDPARKRTKHCFVTDIKSTIDPAAFEAYTKFCVVRNPFDRMVSWYSMFQNGFGKDDAMMKVSNQAEPIGIYLRGLKMLNNPRFPYANQVRNVWINAFQWLNRAETNSFDEIAMRYTTIGANVMNEIQKHVQCFNDFVNLPCDHPSGLFERFYINQLDYIVDQDDTVLVNRILRFEHLAEDFAQLAQEIGFDGQLPHINKSTRGDNYRSYYDDQTRQAIFERFRRDFDYFGYSF